MVFRINPQTAGFSLIEMMVVVAILSILALGVTLSLGRGATASDRAVAALQSDAKQARHLAMQSGLDHALIFVAGGWQVARQSGSGWTQLRAVNPRGLRIDSPSPALLVLKADGQVEPLDVTLESGGTTRRCSTRDGTLPRCR